MSISGPPVSTGQNLLNLWARLSPLPGGRWLFSHMLAWHAPYSGSTGAHVLMLEPGHCIVRLKDKRRVRNHLNSIHAIALVNLGELCSGLALLSGLPASVRGIVVDISTEYMKKARGTLLAECRCDIPSVSEDCEYRVQADIRDRQQVLVARTTVNWRLGPTES